MFDYGPCDWLVLPLALPTLTTQFSLDHKWQSRKRNQKKWKHSDSSDSDSIELMTPLTTLIFQFSLGHKVSYDYDSDSYSDSDSDSDSVASENQPLLLQVLWGQEWQNVLLPMLVVLHTWKNACFCPRSCQILFFLPYSGSCACPKFASHQNTGRNLKGKIKVQDFADFSYS